MSTTSLTLHYLFLLFIPIFLFPFPPLPVSVRAKADEFRALLEFKKGIKNDPTRKIDKTWNYTVFSTSSDVDICPHTFHGVVCDDKTNSVVSVSLEGMNLEGDIKFSTLIALKSLRNLSLAGNLLSGRLVPQLGSISSLELLDLGDNMFVGSVPDRIHDLWNLKWLNLSNNRFSGWYPAGIGNLQQLRVFDLSGNGVFGDVGMLFSELRNVEFVDLSRNRFSGGLPVDVGNVSTLGNTVRHLNLSGNLLGGGFLSRETLALFKSLEVLDLGGNFISGELPSFGGLFNLKVLRVSRNQLYGEIPVELLTNFVPLMELDLSENGFSGSIGSINSTTLEVLELSSNRLTGSFPEFSSQTTLTTLRISNNSFEGGLPLEWTPFSKLSKMDLSVNNFSGLIPPTLFNLGLMDLNLSRNHFNGEISFPGHRFAEFLVQPVFAPLESLDLSDNLLEGGLSKDIGSLVSLKLLNLAKNSLSGLIPDSLESINGLESLDLSNNRFEGHLPKKLSSTLKVLNVTYNDLSGVVPDNLRRFPFSSFHPGNIKLNLPGGSNYSPGEARHHSSKATIRVAIILASIGAALMIAFVLIAYYRAQNSFHGRTKFNGATTGTRTSRSKFHARSESQTSLNLSNDLLLTSNSRALSGQTENAGVGSNILTATPNLPENPIVTSERKSSDSPVLSSPRFSVGSEQPITLDVYSPDRFAGELFFLDTFLSFTAEQLSRSPAEVLGRSSHGTLYKATLNAGQILTVKWLRVGLVKNKKEFAKEVKKIGSLRHPNLVALRAYYWGPREQERLILSDYVSGDSLALHLYESAPRRHSSLSLTQRLKIAVDVARALVFLHERGMPHGNLKPTNILLSGPEFNSQLTDYGLHRLMTPAGVSEQILNLGALGYRAPELASVSKPITTLKADVYALGVILMELLTRRSAGDIISGQSGAVDLTDWVRLCDREGRRMDCIDRDIEKGEESLKAMDEILGISLRCILPVNERPNARQVFEDLGSISG